MKFVDNTVCTHWNYTHSQPVLGGRHHDVHRGTSTARGKQTGPPRTRATPTFHPPQRIGGLADIGAIDIAAVDVKPHSGEADNQKDACLLFRGKPVKCYVLPVQPTNGPGQSIHDESNVMDVVYPTDGPHARCNQLCTYHDRGRGSHIHAPTRRYEGSYLSSSGRTTTSGAARVLQESKRDPSSRSPVAATHDVTHVLSRNRNRFYVEEAGEFFIKIDTGLAHWRYVEGSYNPCDATNTGDILSVSPMRPASIRHGLRA